MRQDAKGAKTPREIAFLGVLAIFQIGETVAGNHDMLRKCLIATLVLAYLACVMLALFVALLGRRTVSLGKEPDLMVLVSDADAVSLGPAGYAHGRLIPLGTFIWIPKWIVYATAIVPAVLIILRWSAGGIRLSRSFEERRLQAAGRCGRCGYDLRGGHERCPECGAPCR